MAIVLWECDLFGHDGDGDVIEVALVNAGFFQVGGQGRPAYSGFISTGTARLASWRDASSRRHSHSVECGAKL